MGLGFVFQVSRASGEQRAEGPPWELAGPLGHGLFLRGLVSQMEEWSVMQMMYYSELTSFLKRPFWQMLTGGSPWMNTKSRWAQLCQRTVFLSLKAFTCCWHTQLNTLGSLPGMQHHFSMSLPLGRNYFKITFTMTAVILLFFKSSTGLQHKLFSLH